MAYKVSNINDLFIVKSDGAIEFGTSGAGTATYVLTSAGANATPTWTEPTNGTVTSIKLNADSGNTDATAITTSGIFTFDGGTNITTSVSGKTVTINADLSGTVTGSGTLNKVARWTATGSDIGDGPIAFSNATASAISTFGGNIKIQEVSLSNQENTDVDSAAAEMVAQVAIATHTAAFFDFVIKKTTNVRSGTVYACHDGAGTPLVAFTETSTQDLGDTSDVTLSVDISGTDMRLRATTTSDNWSIKSLIRAI